MTQQANQFYYDVVYSDGVTVIDSITAPNLKEAKKIAGVNAREKNYPTAYYKVARSYNRGQRASSGIKNWH